VLVDEFELGKCSWRTTTLGEVCKMYQPKTLSRKQMNLEGAYPVYGANGIIGYHSEFNHESQQVVIGCRGTIGKVHLTQPESWINGNAMVIQSIDNKILKSYLFYLLQDGINLSSAVSGAAQPQVTRTSLSPLVVSYPTDLREQKRIVDYLDSASGQLDRQNQSLLEQEELALSLVQNKLKSVFALEMLDSRSVPFLEAIDPVPSSTKIKKRDFKIEGLYPIISQESEFVNGYWDDPSDVLRLDAPVVVFGDHTRTLKFVDFDFVRGADGLKVLLPKDGINARFFYHQLRSFELKDLGYARHYRLLKSTSIKVPEPWVQEEIATMFDNLDVHVNKLKDSLANKRSGFEQLRTAIVRGLLTKTGDDG